MLCWTSFVSWVVNNSINKSELSHTDQASSLTTPIKLLFEPPIWSTYGPHLTELKKFGDNFL